MEICPKCDCKDFYIEKAFPKPLGLIIVGIAILASFWTYGLSLIGAAILDGLIYKLVPNRLVCYRCRAVFSKVKETAGVKGFDHHLAELYHYGQDRP